MPSKQVHKIPDEHKHELDMIAEILNHELRELGRLQQAAQRMHNAINEGHQRRLNGLLGRSLGQPEVPEGALVSHNLEDYTITVLLPEEEAEEAARPARKGKRKAKAKTP